MGKYLKHFGSDYEYQQYYGSGNFVTPNVSAVGTIYEGSGGGNMTIDAVHYTADFGSSYGG
jgi:hypothetical protein